MLARLVIALTALIALPVAAQAAGSVALNSKVFLEKTEIDRAGRSRIVLHEPKLVTPGDTLVFIVDYRNTGTAPAGNFIVTNPVPPAIAYRGASDGTAQVSVDGGKSWGGLSALTVREPNGRVREARAEDVTHIRWALKRGVAAGAQGKLSFRGVVR